MGPETNIDLILSLEKRIEEGTEDVIHLKRARNSLLNISARVPPEILGHIFCWNVIPQGYFGGLRKGSYNFLLVCHYWLEVASGIPELWSFWGNTLEQWSRRYQHSKTTPIDVVLDAIPVPDIPFDGPLRETLRDRAASDSIRSLHLGGWYIPLLRSVISSLTPDGEGTRSSSIESLVLDYDDGDGDPDIYNFLARHRFPRLRNLRISTDAGISYWGHFKLQSSSLTTLSLRYGATPSSPTVSQLLSILASYPNLQDLSFREELDGAEISHGISNESAFRVPLRCLKKLYLRGSWRHVFRLLDQLEYPDRLGRADLYLECATEGISELLAPYLQERIRRDGRFQGRLAIDASDLCDYPSFEINATGKFGIPTALPWHEHPSMSFWVLLKDPVPQGAGEKLFVNFVALAPREHVVRFAARLSTHAIRDLVATMPNIEYLDLTGLVVSDMFLQPDPPSRTKLLPSLRRLSLSCFTLQNDDDWGPLINYLIHQTSDGQAISLRFYGAYPPVPSEVAREVEDLVERFSARKPSTKQR